MNRIVAGVLTIGMSVFPVAAHGQPCGLPKMLALRFVGPAPDDQVVSLRDPRPRQSFEFVKSLDPKFPRTTWIHDRGGPTKVAEFKGLRFEGRCSNARLTGPQVARLEDGVCYGVIEATVTSTCWSLRVVSNPYGYPFQVLVGAQPRDPRAEGSDKGWDVEPNLPRAQPANVRIMARGTINPLLSIQVSYARLQDQQVWELSEKEKKASVVVQDDTPASLQGGSLYEDGILARKAQLWEENPVLRELAIRLYSVESPP